MSLGLSRSRPTRQVDIVPKSPRGNCYLLIPFHTPRLRIGSRLHCPFPSSSPESSNLSTAPRLDEESNLSSLFFPSLSSHPSIRPPSLRSPSGRRGGERRARARHGPWRHPQRRKIRVLVRVKIPRKSSKYGMDFYA